MRLKRLPKPSSGRWLCWKRSRRRQPRPPSRPNWPRLNPNWRFEMWITQVELHQIKSYGKRTTIDLAQGVNAICGKNGAGKSTILEAIGLALFGKSAYKNQEQFIHEKAKKGEITITLFDSRDERLYQVVRPIKGGAPYVYDPETRRELATGVEDVQQWLRDCIRVEPTTDLK